MTRPNASFSNISQLMVYGITDGFPQRGKGEKGFDFLPANILRNNVRYLYARDRAKTWGEFFRFITRELARKIKQDFVDDGNYEGADGDFVPRANDPFIEHDLPYDFEEFNGPVMLPPLWQFEYFIKIATQDLKDSGRQKKKTYGNKKTRLPRLQNDSMGWLAGMATTH